MEPLLNWLQSLHCKSQCCASVSLCMFHYVPLRCPLKLGHQSGRLASNIKIMNSISKTWHRDMTSKSCFSGIASIPFPKAAFLRALLSWFCLGHRGVGPRWCGEKGKYQYESTWTGEWMAMHDDVILKMPQTVQPLKNAKSCIILNPPLHTSPLPL